MPQTTEDGDALDSISSTATLEPGGSFTGTIEPLDDVDFIGVTFSAGVLYRFDYEGSATEAGTLLDSDFAGIFDADGNRLEFMVQEANAPLGNARVFFTPSADGTYYFAAAAGLQSTGTYTLSVHAVDTGNDLAGDVTTIADVAVGGSFAGEIETIADKDWIAAELTAGATYTAFAVGSTASLTELPDPIDGANFVEIGGIYDADGDLFHQSFGDRKLLDGSEVSFTPQVSGTYFFEIGAGGVGTYQFSLMEGASNDAARGASTTATIDQSDDSSGEVRYFHEGAIDTQGDEDWVSVVLQGGATYDVGLEGISADALASPTILGIRDAEGYLQPETEDAGSNISFTPGETGTYYIQIASGIMEDTGTYRLYVDGGPLPEFGQDLPQDPTTTASIAVGGSYYGVIDHGIDQDWIAVTLDAATSYQIELLDGMARFDTTRPAIAGIFDAEGNLLGEADNIVDAFEAGREVTHGAADSALLFTPSESGTYYISAAGLNIFSAGTYLLQVAEVELDLGGVFRRGGAGPDTISGTYFNDQIFAGPDDDSGDRFDGGHGSDEIGGGLGDDIVIGGEGIDTLYGGVGADTLWGGIEGDLSIAGRDLLWAGPGGDLVNGSAGNNIIGGGPGDDTLYGHGGDDIIYGGRGDAGDTGTNDVIDGGRGSDTIFAAAGDDLVKGGRSGDVLFNGGGSDTVDGGDGADTLWGGGDDDTLTGGEGADIFAFDTGNGTDRITDFDPAEDMLNVASADFASFDAFLASVTETQGSITIAFASTTIIIENITVQDITADIVTLS